MNAFCWKYWKNMTIMYKFTCYEDITKIFAHWNVDHILPKKTILLKEWSVSNRNAPKEIDFTRCNRSDCALYYFYSLRTLLFALRTLQQGCINDFKKQGSNTQSGNWLVYFRSFFLNFEKHYPWKWYNLVSMGTGYLLWISQCTEINDHLPNI